MDAEVSEVVAEKPKPSLLKNLKIDKNLKRTLGKLRKFTSKVPTTVVLVALLVLAAYYIGTLRAEVAYLKKAAPVGSGQSTAGGVAASPQPTGKVPEVGDKDHIRGDRDAKVLLVEYVDLECPFCKKFHPTLKQVVAQYGDDVAWVYRHFPLNFHANAQKEAEATECAGELGGNDKFWEYVDLMFERTTSNGTGFALDKLVPLAGELGLNQGKFKECLDSSKYTKHVEEDIEGGRKAGVAGTPATFALTADGSSKLISGALPFDQIKQSIDEVLKK